MQICEKPSPTTFDPSLLLACPRPKEPKTPRAHGQCTTCTCTLHPQLQQSTWTFLPMDRVILLLVLPTCAIVRCTCLSHGLSTDCMWGQPSCFWSWQWRNYSASFIFCGWREGSREGCHLVLSLAGVQIACEMNIASGGVDAVLLSQSCTHTSFSERVQKYAKWKISTHLASSRPVLISRTFVSN